jgi:predicted flap endonuclease-1-like 5' DNA nuclease
MSSPAAAAASSKTSALAPSSSSASILSSALVQSAFVEAQLAPAGLLKPSAKATVAVSAKLAVLEGVGKATEKQFNSVGIKTVQNLVEITPKQRELIANGPAGGMTQALLDQLIEKAQRCVDFILELSGVAATLAAEEKAKAEREAHKRAQAGSEFVGPRLLPAFIRTCLQTLAEVASTVGPDIHCAPELCELLANLCQCSPGMLRLLIEQGAVQTCIKLVIAPITHVEEARARKKLKAQERAAAAGEDASGEQSKEESKSDDAVPAEHDDDEEFRTRAAIAAAEDDGKTDEQRREEAEIAAAIAAVEEAEAAEARAAAGGGASDADKKKARKQAKKERNGKAASSAGAAAAAAEDSAAAAASSSSSAAPSESKDAVVEKPSSDAADDDEDDDDDDELSALTDLSQVEVIHLLNVLVRACTTASGKMPLPAVEPLPASKGPTLPEDTWDQLRRAPFLTRLVLQSSSKKPDPPSQLVAHLVWENHDTTDRVLDAIFASIHEMDFYDFYAGIKLLQMMLLTVKDSVGEYRANVAMPRLVAEAVKVKHYYKACELLIKATMHLIIHCPLAFEWARQHTGELQWFEHWLGKNKRMPELKKADDKDKSASVSATAAASPAEGQARSVLKNPKAKGVNAGWEKAWDGQWNDTHDCSG